MIQTSAEYAGLSAMGARGETGGNYVKVIWDETSPAGTYFIVANDKGAQKVIGEFAIPPGGHKGRVFIPIDAQGTFIVAGDSGGLKADRSIGICTRRGPAGDLNYDAGTTLMLGAAGAAISSVSGPPR